jgi:branched-chain amino acid transport system substrate-binding protein
MGIFRRRRVALALMTVVAAVVALLAASSGAGAAGNAVNTGTNVNKAVNGKFKKPIMIGAAIATTGANVFSDIGPLTGERMAISDINKAGGIGGQKLKLFTEDTTSTTAGSLTATDAAISHGAQIVLNGCNYDYNAPGGVAAQSAGIIAWSQCAGSPKWGIQGIGELAFTPGILTYAEGNVDAKFGAQKLGKRAFVLCDTWLDYFLQTCQGFKEGLSEYGGTIAGTANINTMQQISVPAVVTQIKNTPNVSFIYFAGAQFNDPAVLRQIRAAGINLPVVGPTAWYGVSWTSAVPNLNNFYVDAPADTYGGDPRTAVEALVNRYHKQTGNYPSDGNFAEGYSTIQILAAAIKATGTTKGITLAHYIESHTFHTVLGTRKFSKTLHAQPARTYVFDKYTNGYPHFSTLETPTGKVNLHL